MPFAGSVPVIGALATPLAPVLTESGSPSRAGRRRVDVDVRHAAPAGGQHLDRQLGRLAGDQLVRQRRLDLVRPGVALGVADDLRVDRLAGRRERLRVGLARRAVAHQPVHVDHHGGLLGGVVGASVAPQRAVHPAQVGGRDRLAVLVLQPRRRALLVVERLRRVPEPQVDAERRAGHVLDRAAVVTEPADAVAVVPVGPLAVGAAGVAAGLRARVVLVRRLRRPGDPARDQGTGRGTASDGGPLPRIPSSPAGCLISPVTFTRRVTTVGALSVVVAVTRTSATSAALGAQGPRAATGRPRRSAAAGPSRSCPPAATAA